MEAVFVSYLLTVSIFAFSTGPDFQVNTRTSNNQANPAIAMDAEGNFVVVWSSYFSTDRSNDIFGQRFGADGEPIGEEFRINCETGDNQKEPSVAMDAQGNFVVAWQSDDRGNENIYARQFEPNSNPVGSEFRVNDDPNGRQLHPRVAMSDTGKFAIVWEDNRYYPQLGACEIKYKLYDCNGITIVKGKANLLTRCRYPDVAMDDNGNFIIVWMQDDIYHASNLIMSRRFDTAGLPKSDPCQVNTTEFFSIAHPSVAGGAGYFIVVWDGNPGPAGQDDIHAHRYRGDGRPISGEFMVNTTVAGAQQGPQAAMNSQGQFVVVWDSKVDPNVNERDIFGQRFDSSGRPIGDEFQVNTYVAGDQKYPAAAIKQNGEFVVVWQSYGQDGSGYGIFGRQGPWLGSADITQDGLVNFRDFCILAEEWLKQDNPLKADLIDDNRIDMQDLAVFCEHWLTPRYWCCELDVDGNGRIDFKDYGLWAGNWLKRGPKLDGDITGNGIADMADLKVLLFYWAHNCEQ